MQLLSWLKLIGVALLISVVVAFFFVANMWRADSLKLQRVEQLVVQLQQSNDFYRSSYENAMKAIAVQNEAVRKSELELTALRARLKINAEDAARMDYRLWAALQKLNEKPIPSDCEGQLQWLKESAPSSW